MFKVSKSYQTPIIVNDDNNSNKLLDSDKFFVTYANPRYFDILYYLLKGLNIYSKIPVIVYIVNNKNNLLLNKFKEFKNIIFRYILSDDHIWATKFTIMIDSVNFIKKENTKFIFLDADTIVNYSIDELFIYSDKIKNIPYLSLHPDYLSAVNSLYDVIGKNKKIEFNKKFGHSNVIWYNSNCINFFKECYYLIIRHRGLGDEPIINYLQNKNNLTENIPYMTPNFSIYKKYINKENLNDQIGLRKTGELKELYLHLFHGCKDINICKLIYNELEEFNLKNPNYKIHYSTNNL